MESYNKNVAPAQLKEMYSLLCEFPNKYNYTILDYFTNKRFIADDFFDVCHLLTEVAEKLTRILLEDLELNKLK